MLNSKDVHSVSTLLYKLRDQLLCNTTRTRAGLDTQYWEDHQDS